MGRALLVLLSDADRAKAIDWIRKAPPKTRVEFKASKRSLPQNDRLWATLTEISQQVDWYGQKLSPDDWKDVFTASLRRARVVPGLDAGTFVPLGMRTSDMTKEEFSDLLELINAFAAERGVTLHDPADSPPSADEAESDGASAEGEVSVDAASPSPQLVECCRKILGTTQGDMTGREKQDVLITAKNMWKERLPADQHDKLKAFVESANAIIKDETSFDAAVEYFAEQLDVESSELGGE
jgi:hypothetical protein